MSAPLLVELLTEELPPHSLQALSAAFAQGLRAGLIKRGLAQDNAAATAYATPRRLAVTVDGVDGRAADRAETLRLMPARVAYVDGGDPAPALLKRLAKEGVTPQEAKLEQREEDGTLYVFLARTAAGATLEAGLQAALDETLAALPVAKVMSYQLADGETTVQFVRPAHGLVALHGRDVVKVAALGLKAGRVTRGHRFQGADDISIDHASAYADALEAHGKVVPSFTARRARIQAAIAEVCGRVGLNPGGDTAGLLDEVTALVEWPAVYVGGFEAEFLAVPPECLVLTMRANQKYFPLFDEAGRLSNRFLIVSNLELADPSRVVQGNERVIRPRLADARFFYDTDRKTPLASRVPGLEKVVYHNKLGSQLQRAQRVEKLAAGIASLAAADAGRAQRAALLAKADLLTNMVGEFPELQGVMGRYYALHDGEDAEVAQAIEEQYRPRYAGDALPETRTGLYLALADKLETLAGLFGLGQQPTGDKDPYALRRAALGVARILVECDLPLSLPDLTAAAFATFEGKVQDAQSDLQTFIYDRLRGYLREAGYSANEIAAVVDARPARLGRVVPQLQAVREFSTLPEAASLAAANKRVANILKQAEAKGEAYARAGLKGLKEPAEKSLQSTLASAQSNADACFAKDDYAGYLRSFAVLKGPVDSFFEHVMVMVEDEPLRHSRLALLADLRAAMNRFADIAKLAA